MLKNPGGSLCFLKCTTSDTRDVCVGMCSAAVCSLSGLLSPVFDLCSGPLCSQSFFFFLRSMFL